MNDKRSYLTQLDAFLIVLVLGVWIAASLVMHHSTRMAADARFKRLEQIHELDSPEEYKDWKDVK